MADSGLLIDSTVFEQSFGTFQETEWPSAVLFTGEQIPEKEDLILRKAGEILAQFDGSGSKVPLAFLKDNSLPDFVYFGGGRVPIGETSGSEPGTIRYLLQRVLPYAPRNGKLRFIFFSDAAAISNEAESALLKSLEEPPPGTVFLLSSASTDELKDTIVSRSLQIELRMRLSPAAVPPDPWERFWLFSGLSGSKTDELLERYDWKKYLRESYDKLDYSHRDFLLFDEMGNRELKSRLSREKSDTQYRVSKITFLPLYFSLRDRILHGQATLGPLSLPEKFSRTQMLKLSGTMRSFFDQLSLKFFGNIPVNYNIAFSQFLAEFIPQWKFTAPSTPEREETFRGERAAGL